MPRISAIHRHPVKALGSEALARVALEAGRTLPGDRVWALAHEKSRFDFDAPAWARCSTFLRGATFPSLMAVTAEGEAVLEGGGEITFRHPDLPPLTVDPATPEGEAAFVAWADALIPAGAPRPARLAHAPGRGMTDQPAQWLSVLSDASLAAVAEAAGRPMDRRRFRGNLWIEGLAPWEETSWIGREIRLGACLLRVTEPIGRCSATHADPETGKRDLDMLALLTGLGQAENFGVFAEVIEGGDVAQGDLVMIPEAAA